MRYGQTAIADGTKLSFSLRRLRDVLETITLERVEQRLTRLEGPLAPPCSAKSPARGDVAMNAADLQID